jgi:hypothetical protein
VSTPVRPDIAIGDAIPRQSDQRLGDPGVRSATASDMAMVEYVNSGGVTILDANRRMERIIRLP